MSLQIQRPGISHELLAKANVRQIGSEEASSLIGYSQEGLIIPYYNRRGEPVKFNGKDFARLRLSHPKNSAKYLSPAGSTCQLYEPFGLSTLLKLGCTIGIVEGEFKALALVEAGYPCVGIGGITAACPRNSNQEPELLPALSLLLTEFKPTGVFFIGDSDTSLIPSFSREAVKLAQLCDMPVLLPRIPIDAPGKGADDLREIWGAEFPAKWQRMLDEAETVTKEIKTHSLAVRLLLRESESFSRLSPDGMSAARERLVKLGAAFHKEVLSVDEITAFAAKVAGLSKQTFRSAVKNEISRLAAASGSNRDQRNLSEFEESSTASQLFYDGRAYWRKGSDGNFGQLCREDARLELGMAGLNLCASAGTPSLADRALHGIQINNRVDYAGPLCGRPVGLHSENNLKILVTRGPNFIEPKAGESPTITALLGNLLGRAAGDPLAARQAEIFIGWLKLAREAAHNPHRHLPGQILALIGPPDCGKSLVQSCIITPALGGRVADPSLWTTGGTTFNADLWGAEHLAIGDKSLGDDGRERARLRDELKRIVAAPDYPLHGKHRDGLTLRPIWRVSLSANDDPESASSLPALDASFEDKIIYLQCYAPPEPFFNANDHNAKNQFRSALRDELPAFLKEVDSFTIPAELAKGRFGISEFHHPAILDLLQSSSPLIPLADILDSWIKSWDAEIHKKEYSATDLFLELDAFTDNRLRLISSKPSHLGHQLARFDTLAGWKGRVTRTKRRINNNQQQTLWVIHRIVAS